MEIKYIDIHSHLGFEDYSQDLKEVIKRMENSGVAAIVVGTDLESSEEAIKIAEENKNIFACIGVHPDERRNSVFNEKDFEKLVKNPKVVAIGECGLDYFVDRESKVESGKSKVISNEEKERQKKEFIKQIEFAVKHDKPLMLHLRDSGDSSRISRGETLGIKKGFSSGNSVYQDAYEILKNHKNVKANLHFFAGSLEWAKKFIELGFTISFTGAITFARQYDEVIKNIPLDKIHAETDAPFVVPVPYRGKRNEPAYVIEVVKKIAEIRGEDLEMVRLQLLKNAKQVFGI